MKGDMKNNQAQGRRRVTDHILVSLTERWADSGSWKQLQVSIGCVLLPHPCSLSQSPTCVTQPCVYMEIQLVAINLAITWWQELPKPYHTIRAGGSGGTQAWDKPSRLMLHTCQKSCFAKFDFIWQWMHKPERSLSLCRSTEDSKESNFTQPPLYLKTTKE